MIREVFDRIASVLAAREAEQALGQATQGAAGRPNLAAPVAAGANCS